VWISRGKVRQNTRICEVIHAGAFFVNNPLFFISRGTLRYFCLVCQPPLISHPVSATGITVASVPPPPISRPPGAGQIVPVPALRRGAVRDHRLQDPKPGAQGDRRPPPLPLLSGCGGHEAGGHTGIRSLFVTREVRNCRSRSRRWFHCLLPDCIIVAARHQAFFLRSVTPFQGGNGSWMLGSAGYISSGTGFRHPTFILNQPMFSNKFRIFGAFFWGITPPELGVHIKDIRDPPPPLPSSLTGRWVAPLPGGGSSKGAC